MKMLKFYTDTCPPCRMMSPVVKLACEKTNIELESVDANDDKRALDFDIRNVPTLVLIKDEKEVSRKVGMTPLNKLIDWIKEHGV